MPYRIAIATDHGGFNAKNELLIALAADGHRMMDCGTYEPGSTDYPIYASRLAEAVSRGLVDFGILLCKSGIGMSMVANRFQGVRAALANSPATAAICRVHNNANVLVMGNDYMSAGFKELADIFLATEFEGGRHARRVGQIDILDQIIESNNSTGYSQSHGQAVWSHAPNESLNNFAPTKLRGYVITFQSILDQMNSDDDSVGELLKNNASDIDQKLLPFFDHEIHRVAETLAPIASFTLGQDGCIVVPVPVMGDASTGDILKIVTSYDERWTDFTVAYRICTNEAGIDAAFELLKSGHSIVLFGVSGLDQLQELFERFRVIIPKLSSTTAHLYFQLNRDTSQEPDLTALIREKTEFTNMAKAYERGIPTPCVIREGATLGDDFIPGTKFLIGCEEDLTVEMEEAALKQIQESR